MLVIIGTEYIFNPMEKEILIKKFKNLVYVNYEDNKQLLKVFKTSLNKDTIDLVLLNVPKDLENIVAKKIADISMRRRDKISTIESFFENYLRKCYIPKDYTNFNFLANIKGYTRFQYFQKRVIDYVGVLVLFLLSFIVMIISYFTIKRQSPGDVIFKQNRVGKYGKEFVCYKFRSMSADAEKDGVKFASKNDTRVFPFGQIMRKTRIDELPQLLDVLKGEMHLVGPRPERDFWIKEFKKHIPFYNERHIISPGITGWAQVCYPYGENEEDARQKLMYDLYYIKHWSLKLELEIVFKTILVIFGKKGI